MVLVCGNRLENRYLEPFPTGSYSLYFPVVHGVITSPMGTALLPFVIARRRPHACLSHLPGAGVWQSTLLGISVQTRLVSVPPRNQRPNVRVSDRTCLLLAACTHGAAATGDRARARRISTPHHQRAPYPSRSAIHGGRCAINPINKWPRAAAGRAGRPAPSIHARPPYARARTGTAA